MICRFLFEDHRKIDALFARLRRDLSELHGSPEANADTLAESFRVVDERLERHIRWEEQLLFPAAEAKAPELARGASRVMRLEHTQIRSYMNDIRIGFATPPLAAEGLERIRDMLQTAESLLNAHNEKEETVYYPLCDRLLTSEEAARVLDQVRETL